VITRTKQNILIWSKNFGMKQNYSIWPGNGLMQSGTFLFNAKTYIWKQNISIWFNFFYQNEITFVLGYKFWDKAKQFDLFQKFRNRTKWKLLDQNFWVLMFCFNPEFCFKNEYIQFYWNESRKRKLSILNKCWFEDDSDEGPWWYSSPISGVCKDQNFYFFLSLTG
jgi:hypothetical protein